MPNNKGNGKHQSILESAIRVFARQGFFQSTISQIAREAGVADGTIYLYFKNKEDILIQIFSFKTAQVFKKFQKEVDKAGNSLDKLKNLVSRHLEEFQRDRDMAVLYQVETRRQSRLFEPHIKKMSEMYMDIVSEIVEQGQQEGTIRRDLYVSLVKRFILGGVDEVINTWLHSKKKYDLTSMADPLVELFINGIGAKAESGKTGRPM
jgi:TetR/AcrR family transcriptional regulator, fatty acid metabolism regulator protein